MAEWCHLPADLLHMISIRLETSIDTVRFRSVCSAWRSSARPGTIYNPFPTLPQDGFPSLFDGFILYKRTIFHLSCPPSPIPRSHSDPNSPTHSDSWLIKTELSRPGFLRLFNPMSRSHIEPLPSGISNLIDLSKIRVRELRDEYALQFTSPGLVSSHEYMEKVAYLPETDRDYMVMTIHISGRLALYKSAGRKWSLVSEPESIFDDVTVFEGKFFAVDTSGKAFMVEAPESRNMVVSQVAGPVDGGDRKCLVKLDRDLLLVDIHLGFPAEYVHEEAFLDDQGQDDSFDSLMSMRPIQVKIFKLDKDEQSWIEVKSLGDHLLFLGDNGTFSIRASELSGCKGNCIMFNLVEHQRQLSSNAEEEEDDAFRFCRDILVFTLDDGKIEPCATYPSYTKLFWPPPSWVTSASPEV